MQKRVLSLVAVAALALAASSQAAVITTSGIAKNTEVAEWSRTTTVKTLDLDGDNYYGTVGYIVRLSNASYSKTPAFCSDLSVPAGYWQNNGVIPGNPAILNPTDTGSGAAKNFGGITTNGFDAYTFTINSSIAAGTTLRVGVMTGGSYVVNGNSPWQLSGTDSTAVSQTFSDPGAPNLYFWDITGAKSGDVFTVSAMADGGSGKSSVGITLDAVVPEPIGISLVGLSGLALLRRRRHA